MRMVFKRQIFLENKLKGGLIEKGKKFSIHVYLALSEKHGYARDPFKASHYII